MNGLSRRGAIAASRHYAQNANVPILNGATTMGPRARYSENGNRPAPMAGGTSRLRKPSDQSWTMKPPRPVKKTTGAIVVRAAAMM